MMAREAFSIPIASFTIDSIYDYFNVKDARGDSKTDQILNPFCKSTLIEVPDSNLTSCVLKHSHRFNATQDTDEQESF